MSFSFLPPPTLWRACGAAQVPALASQRSLPCPRQSQQTSMVRVLRRPLSAFQLRAAIRPFVLCFRERLDVLASIAKRHELAAIRQGDGHMETERPGHATINQKELSEPHQYRRWFGNCESGQIQSSLLVSTTKPAGGSGTVSPSGLLQMGQGMPGAPQPHAVGPSQGRSG
jgi:hypothetical protein